ncbi:uncharacterized protein TNCV_2464241 [Trichonephila clavipes]|nr:uncharacterized protein TNCV_2464241 [Trichonephila clavipes]
MSFIERNVEIPFNPLQHTPFPYQFIAAYEFFAVQNSAAALLLSPSLVDADGLRDLMCNHGRAIDLFISSIMDSDCKLLGAQCESWEEFVDGKCGNCNTEHGQLCVPLGINSIQFANHIQKNSRPSSFHTLPKLIWCGSWGYNVGQSLSNHEPHVFYRRKIRRASQPGKQLNLVIDEEPLDNACHVKSGIILLKYGCGQALNVKKDNWLQHLGDVALAI